MKLHLTCIAINTTQTWSNQYEVMNGELDLTPVSLQFVLKKAQFRYQAHVAYPLPELSRDLEANPKLLTTS